MWRVGLRAVIYSIRDEQSPSLPLGAFGEWNHPDLECIVSSLVGEGHLTRICQLRQSTHNPAVTKTGTHQICRGGSLY